MTDNNIPTFGAPAAPPMTNPVPPPVSMGGSIPVAPVAPEVNAPGMPPVAPPMSVPSMPTPPPLDAPVDLPPLTPSPSDSAARENPVGGPDATGVLHAPEMTPPPVAGAAPPPPPPAPLKQPKKSLPLPAIIVIVLGLIIIIGVVIYFTLIQGSGQTTPTPTPSTTSSLTPLPSPSATPRMSTMAAVLASNYSRSLDVNCVIGGDNRETIAYAEVPFILNQQVRQSFDLLLADGVECLGSSGGVAGSAVQEGTRYVQLVAAHDLGELAYDQVFFVHEGSQPEPGLATYTDNAFDFPEPAGCTGANMCYQLADGTEMYFVTNQPNPFAPEQFCVALSNAGKLSDDETLLAKAYVGECIQPVAIPTMAAVYATYGRADANGVWQMNQSRRIGDFYAELSSAYQRLPNYAAMQVRLQTILEGIEL